MAEDVVLAGGGRLRRRCPGRDVTDGEVARHIGPYLRRHMVQHLLYLAGRLG